jgi:hypothetical protein
VFYKILQDRTCSRKVFIPKIFAHINNLMRVNFIEIQFGNLRCKVKVEVTNNISEEEIILSKDIIELFLIPLDVEYQINFDKGCMNIGPVIGLLFSRKDKILIRDLESAEKQSSLSLEPPSGLSSYTTLSYNGIKGLLYAFSVEGINFENNYIRGFYYNPNLKEPQRKWKEGIFPFPTAIYKRAYISKGQSRKKLKKLTQNRMFNSYWRDKWDFWNEMSNNPDIKKHLPYTEVFSSFEGLDKMLGIYKTVYIKLANGQLAHGLVRVSKKRNNYLFQKVSEENPVIINEKANAENFLNNINKKRRYIIQEGIETIRYEERCISFRVIMQKDETLKWKCTGICPRVGKVKGICSNYKPGLYDFTFESLLSKSMQLEEDIISQKKKEIIDVCFKLCEESDATGENFGDIGIDIGIDKALRVWIFEINDGHRHHVTLKIGDKDMYYKVKSNPLRYAAGLSGFKYYKH